MAEPGATGEGPATGERKKNRTVVRIFGEEHRLSGEEPAAFLQDLAARVDGRMREIAGGNPRLGTAQVAVLAALNATSDLMRLEEQYHRVLALLEREWERRKAETVATAPAQGPARPRDGR